MQSLMRKRLVLLGSLVFVLITSIVIAGLVATRTYAADELKKTVSSYLDQKDITYSSVTVDNNTLSVVLLSNGEDRCTLEDVKAIHAIYEAVHAQTIDGDIKNIGIEIYNTNGVLIYDIFEKNVSLPIENAELLVDSSLFQKTGSDDNNILSITQSIVSSFPFSIQLAHVVRAEELTGNKVTLSLTKENDTNIMSDVRSIYEQLESYALSTGAIVECEISVFNTNGDCVLYMAGDFQYGNCIAWISPIIEKSFFAEEGPQ